MHLGFLWFGAMVLFIILENITVSITSVWFAAGALGALILSLFGLPFWLQISVFLVISGVLLALLRPLVKKRFEPKITPTNVDSILGSVGKVLEPIDNISSTGQVKVGSLPWSARSTDGKKIPQGALVKVDSVHGVKVYVSVIEE